MGLCMNCVMRRTSYAQAGLAAATCAILLATATPSWAKHEPEPDTELTDSAIGETKVKPVPLVPEFVSPLEKVKKYEYLYVEGSAWKKANDNVGEIGGWAVYSRERPDTELMEDSETMQDPETMEDSEKIHDHEAIKDPELQDSSAADHENHK